MQDGRKAVWSIRYVSEAFFQSLKHNFIAYRSSKLFSRPDCIFEIHQLWQSDFSRMYSNSCGRCSFDTETIKIGQSSHMMDSNNIMNFQMSTAILNACTKKTGNLLNAPRISILISISPASHPVRDVFHTHLLSLSLSLSLSHIYIYIMYKVPMDN